MSDATRDIVSAAFFAVGSAGFIRFGCCLVYLICDAESLTPVWVERTVLAALQARDRARLAVVTALLALALRLNSIPSAPQKGALR